MRRRKQAREARLAQDQVGAITVRERDALARPVRARARANSARLGAPGARPGSPAH